ncbi:hypothetical protein [uncultured Friedmanniella sp.]|uniref:hypothetical protein n=1 Tax=uncultured Friedmanniella sp. TaxID=335381 RepID=UPI0035CAA608
MCAGIINDQATVSRLQRASRTARVLQTARSVHLVSDLDDHATWLDAQDAFPR